MERTAKAGRREQDGTGPAALTSGHARDQRHPALLPRPAALARIFHTLRRRVRARGLQARRCMLVGRVPSRGALSAFPSECEIGGLASRFLSSVTHFPAAGATGDCGCKSGAWGSGWLLPRLPLSSNRTLCSTLHLCTAILQYARKLRGLLRMNCHAKRMECVQLLHPPQRCCGGRAGAVLTHGGVESGSKKLHAVQTLRAVQLRLCSFALV